MKFVKIPQHNNKDFLLINLSQIIYVAANAKAGSCKVYFVGGETITCMPQQGYVLLKQISEYNRQLLEFIQVQETGDEF